MSNEQQAPRLLHHDAEQDFQSARSSGTVHGHARWTGRSARIAQGIAIIDQPIYGRDQTIRLFTEVTTEGDFIATGMPSNSCQISGVMRMKIKAGAHAQSLEYTAFSIQITTESVSYSKNTMYDRPVLRIEPTGHIENACVAEPQ